jgi:hypothetical protein
VDFKLEYVLVSLHSLKTMGLQAPVPLFSRNGELLGHSPILKLYRVHPETGENRMMHYTM